MRERESEREREREKVLVSQVHSYIKRHNLADYLKCSGVYRGLLKS